MNKYLFSILCGMLMVQTIGLSQGGLVAEYTMNSCTLDDDVGGHDGFVFGPNPCGCGVQSNGLEFDGDIHFGEFSPDLITTFQGDFSMSFYVFFLNGADESVDLFSIGPKCTRDSIFFIRYFPSVKQLRVRLSDSPGNEVELKGSLSANRCWNYITVTKSGAVLSLYIDGELIDQDGAVSELRLNVDDNLSIANGPCLAVISNPDVRFRGRIDELRIYNRALSLREIQDFDFMPDRIITSDTTIFIGESIQILTGGSCSNNFTWFPDTGLSGGDALNPIASPEQSTTYSLTVIQEGCEVVDDVRINVVTSDEVSCNDLKLPSAFTPNGDRINDTYGISNDFIIETLISFEVFNKWGGRVFYTNQFGDNWDGIYQSEKAAPGAYIYKVRYLCQGAEHLKTGTVNLLK